MYAEKMSELVTNELARRDCYNKNVIPAIVSQAIVESNNGNSTLARIYHNHFGMKCGAYWKGNSINMKTKEEVNGAMVDVSDNFRVYANDEEGVAGFFDFISTKRYENLQSCNTPREWLETIKADGYCTASNYVDICMKYVDFVSKKTFPSYKEGCIYTLRHNMIVRTNPLRSSQMVGHGGLTRDGKNHDKDKNGTLDAGTEVTCKGVCYYADEAWLKIPSGWICGYDATTIYVS